MSGRLASVLKAYLTKRKRETLKKGWAEIPEWLFYNEDGNMIDVTFGKGYSINALKKAE
jgi:hypothetical protein